MRQRGILTVDKYDNATVTTDTETFIMSEWNRGLSLFVTQLHLANNREVEFYPSYGPRYNRAFSVDFAGFLEYMRYFVSPDTSIGALTALSNKAIGSIGHILPSDDLVALGVPEFIQFLGYPRKEGLRVKRHNIMIPDLRNFCRTKVEAHPPYGTVLMTFATHYTVDPQNNNIVLYAGDYRFMHPNIEQAIYQFVVQTLGL